MSDSHFTDDAFINSMIGEGTRIKGELDLNGLLRIDGDFTGVIRTKGKVLVGKNGRAECTLSAGTVVIGGVFRGEIISTEKVIILSTGLVIGSITTPRLVIEEGVIFNGSCKTAVPPAAETGPPGSRQRAEDRSGGAGPPGAGPRAETLTPAGAGTPWRASIPWGNPGNTLSRTERRRGRRRRPRNGASPTWWGRRPNPVSQTPRTWRVQARTGTWKSSWTPVFSSGDQLKKAPTLEAIKDYRHRVKEFIRYAVDHGVSVEETTSGVNILRRKRFTLVKVIDEKLQALAASVLAAQKDQLAILAQIDEINGLLVNLVS